MNMINKLQDVDQEQIDYFVLVHGREPESLKEIVEEQEKEYRQLGGNY